MTAWSSDFKTAPKEQPVLVRNPAWECLAVMKYTEEYTAYGDWMFCESALQDIDGSLVDTSGCEWAPIPE
jgi:hypothetical protein